MLFKISRIEKDLYPTVKSNFNTHKYFVNHVISGKVFSAASTGIQKKKKKDVQHNGIIYFLIPPREAVADAKSLFQVGNSMAKNHKFDVLCFLSSWLIPF